jgi:oxygen-independent coproporphyrinogen-3 oxidase
MEGLGPPQEEALRHLYVHVPFCHKICPYCSFYKHLPGEGGLDGYAGALLAEARLLRSGPVPLALETVYFGGGTPTLLSRNTLDKLLPELAGVLDFSAVTEWTMEVNPRTINPDKAAVMRQAGVTRVSLGVQAWDQPTLTTLGRDHAPEEAEEAWHLLRAAGFPVVNLDLMFSVPGQPLEAWQETLHRTVALQPDHVSAYNLTYEEDTEFFERCQTGQYAVAEDRDELCFAAAMETLGAAGLEHYEISNYSRPGFESRHNQSYWAGEDYAGLGPGAVSTIHGQRFKNIENTTLWQQGTLAGQPLRTEHEIITPDKWLCERLALGLRTRQGLPESWLTGAPEAVSRLLEEGLIQREAGQLRLTHRGKFVADGVAAHLWEAVGP